MFTTLEQLLAATFPLPCSSMKVSRRLSENVLFLFEFDFMSGTKGFPDSLLTSMMACEVSFRSKISFFSLQLHYQLSNVMIMFKHSPMSRYMFFVFDGYHTTDN